MRRFINYALLALVLVLGVFLSSRLQLGQQRYLYLSPDHYPPGSIHPITLKLNKGGRIYVVNNAGTFVAVIATDTYDNCMVSWQQKAQALVSPCSGSKYTPDGRYISGPSGKSLDRFATHIRYGNLLIDTETRIPGEKATVSAPNASPQP